MMYKLSQLIARLRRGGITIGIDYTASPVIAALWRAVGYDACRLQPFLLEPLATASECGKRTALFYAAMAGSLAQQRGRHEALLATQSMAEAVLRAYAADRATQRISNRALLSHAVNTASDLGISHLATLVGQLYQDGSLDTAICDPEAVYFGLLDGGTLYRPPHLTGLISTKPAAYIH